MLYLYFLIALVTAVKSLCFYQDGGRSGWSWSVFNPGCTNVPAWFNDKMTSWDEVMTWEKVYIYADADCSGDVWYLNKPAGDVVDEANDVMSSVRIVSLSDASNELKNVVENLPNHDISMIKVIPGNSTVKAGKVDSKVSL